MRFAIFLMLVTATTCAAQSTQSGSASSTGSCSPAVTGSHNSFTISCQNIPKPLQAQLQDLINRLVKDQSDAQAVLTKLDGCLAGVKAVREDQQPWRLTDMQKAGILAALRTLPVGNVKVTVNVIGSDHNAQLMGTDLISVLTTAGWASNLGLNNDFTLNPQIVGIIIVVKDPQQQQANLLLNALRAAGLQVQANIDSKGERATDEKSIFIAVGAKPVSSQ